MTFDLLITGGTVYDGSGSAGVRHDVAVRDDAIAAIGDLQGAEAAGVIDAADMAVAPGFIDTHTHSEGVLLADPEHALGLRQGITTEIGGLDGMSFAPLSDRNYRQYRHYLGGILGPTIDGLDMSSISAFRGHYDRKVAVNFAYLLPLGAVWLETVGFGDVPLGREAMRQAKTIVRDAIEQGAVGFSTGAAYYPGAWVRTDELIDLCTAVREAGSIYVCEPRVIHLERTFGGDGVSEALHVAGQSGVRLHMAHHRTNVQTAGRVKQFMAPIDRAKSEGVDFTADIYPYPTGSSILISYLPAEAHEGGPAQLMARLGDSAQRDRFVAHLDTNAFQPLAEIVLTYVANDADLEGRSLPQIALERGVTLGRAVCELLYENDLKVGYLNPPPADTATWRQIGRDALELLARPDYMACSDITPLGALPHPRCFGAFARFLGRLRREHDVISLAQMIQRMTDNPARRFGFARRGRIEEGYFADLVVFDPQNVIDTSTYDDPRQHPAGISYVLVNGRVAVDNGRCTGELAGRALP